MRLFAALVPPPDVLDHVSQLVAGVHVEPEPEPVRAGAGRRGPPGRHAAPSARRFGRRTPPATSADCRPPGRHRAAAGPGADRCVRMHVPIVKFGNLALDDVARLIDALEVQAASGWQSPRLHLHGGVALEPKGDHSVWVRLGGDLDELNAVVRDVSRVAQGLHLFVDRRVFRTDLQLGTINERTTEAYLEQVLAALDAFESPAWWQTTMSLLIPIDLGPDKAPYQTPSAKSRWAPRSPH